MKITAHTKSMNKTLANIIAIATALLLVFLLTAASGLSRQSRADAAAEVAAQVEETGSVDVRFSFDHAFVEVDGQVLAPPASKVTIPADAGLAFTAEADSGYEIDEVEATVGGSTTTLSPDGGGRYEIPASSLVDGKASVRVKAIAVPEPEPEVAEEEEAIEEVAAEEEAAEEGAVEEQAATEEAAGEEASGDEVVEDEGAATEAKSKTPDQLTVKTASVDEGADEPAEAEGGASGNDAPAVVTAGATESDEPASTPEATASNATEISSANATVTVAIYATETDRIAGKNVLDADYEIGLTETLYGTVHFKFKPGEGPKAGRLVFQYKLPDNIKTANKSSTLYDDSGNVAGTWEIDDNVVRFNYDESWAVAHPNGGGSFDFDFTLDEESVAAGTATSFSFPGVTETIPVKVRGYEVTGKKSHSKVVDGAITYTVALDAEETIPEFIFSDKLDKNLHYVADSFKFDNVPFAVEISELEDGKHTATATASREITKGKHTVTYGVTVDQEAFDALSDDATLSDTDNLAMWDYRNPGGKWYHGESPSTVTLKNDLISKDKPGKVVDGNKLEWKIKINYTKEMKSDISGYIVNDELQAGLTYGDHFSVLDENNVEIARVDIPAGAKSFTYTFPADTGVKPRYITYTTIINDVTKAQALKNTARILTATGVKKGSSSKTYNFDPGTPTPSYDGPKPTVVKEVDEDVTHEDERIVTWHTTFSSDEYPEPGSGLEMQYFDSVEEYYVKPDSNKINQEFLPDGSSYYKIWIASEPRMFVDLPGDAGHQLQIGVDYKFDKKPYGFWKYGKTYWGEEKPVAYRVRFILESKTMRQVIANKLPIDIYYETECDGTCQEYVNEARARILKGGVEVYQDVATANFELEGSSRVEKTGSIAWDSDRGRYVAEWTITANRSDDGKYLIKLQSPELTFEDTLPDGMSVIADSAELKVVKPTPGTAGSNETLAPVTVSQVGSVATFTADLSTVTLPDGTKAYDETNKGGVWAQLTFKTELDPAAIVHDGEKQILGNTAKAFSGEDRLGSDTTQVSYTDTVVTKTGNQKDGEPVVHYEIAVNPLAQKLGLADGQTKVNLTDMLDYRTTVVLSSIKVVDAKTKENITSQCAVILDNEVKDDEGNDTTSFTVNVPDGRALVITYDVTLSGNAGTEYDVTNTASLEGVSSTQTTTTQKYKVNHSDASVYGSNTVIFITKTDSRNAVDMNMRLDGAIFELYRVDDLSKLPENPSAEESGEALIAASKLVNTVETDKTGSAVLYDEDYDALQYDTLYFFKEAKAPENYLIDDKRPHFIMLKGENYQQQYDLVKAHGIEPSETTKYNVTDTLETEATVKKVWDDKDNKYGKRPQELKVTLSNGTQVVLNEGNNWEATVEHLPKYAGGELVEYTWTEDENGLPDGYELSSQETNGSITTITNTFHVYADIDLYVLKTLSGRTLHEGEFSFELWEGDNLIGTASNNGDARAHFDTIRYDLDKPGDLGEHVYKIREVVPKDAAKTEDDTYVYEGVTYDAEDHSFTVTVTDNGNGTLNVAYDGYDPETGVSIENTYQAKGEVALTALKKLDNEAPDDGAFEFQLSQKTSSENGETVETPKQKKANGKNGVVEFDPVKFTSAGTYEFIITEVVPEGAVQIGTKWVKDNVVYDTSARKATVVVSDKEQKGTLDVDVTYDDGEQKAFENTTVTPVPFTLSAKKTMEGRDFQDGDTFTFEVAGTVQDGDTEAAVPMPHDANNKAVEKVTIEPKADEEPIVNFGTIDFTANDLGNTYRYTVAEKSEKPIAAVEYDSAHTVDVTVVEAGDGEIGLRYEYDKGLGNGAGEMVFTNKYKAKGDTTLQVSKSLTGRGLEAGEFRFRATLKRIADADGEVAIAEGEPAKNVADASAGADGVATFKLEGVFDQDDAGRTFTYELAEIDTKRPGVTYDASAFEADVKVKDNGDGTLGFETAYYKLVPPEAEGQDPVRGDAAPAAFANEYKAEDAYVDLEATKLLANGALSEGQFTFYLNGVSENASEVKQEATNGADGRVAFERITYDKEGTYEYEITEDVPAGATDNGDGTWKVGNVVYDGRAHAVVVEVTDDAATGKLRAEAKYDGAPALAIANGVQLAHAGFAFDKYCFGGEGVFSFVLEAADAEGNAKAGDPVAFDEGEVVVDDGASAFRLTAQNEVPFVGDKSAVRFPEISYAADGDYYYLVYEDEPDAADMVADKARYLVHVKVENGEAGEPEYKVSSDGAAPFEPTGDRSFYNNKAVTLGFNSLSAQSYLDRERVSVYPKAMKKLNGKTDELVGGDFQFELVDGATGTVIATATNDENGVVAFFDEDADPGLAYDGPGVFSYVIREVPGDAVGVTYDGSVATLTVEVVQTENGLAATPLYSGAFDEGEEFPSFHNFKEGMDVTVQKVSRSGGEGLAGSTYALWMVAEGGDVLVQEATSDARGCITFKDVNLAKGQKYYLKEVSAPSGHTVDPYRTAYFALNGAGDALVLAEETAADGWHSAEEGAAPGGSAAEGDEMSEAM